MAEKKKYNSILISGRKDQTLTYSKYVKDEESGESVKESLDKKVNITDELTAQQIKDGAITNEKLAADSVGNTNLKDSSVSNEKLEDGSITNEKLAENAITKDKLKDNTIGAEKLDPELRQTINAATGLPEELVETIQNVDDTLKDHQSQLDDKQSQIDDKQQQITSNDEDISLLQTRSTQMEETIKGIAATGGASLATSVTYNNENSQLKAVNIQSAVDELQGSKIDKTSIVQESGGSEDKVMSQKAMSTILNDLTNSFVQSIYSNNSTFNKIVSELYLDTNANYNKVTIYNTVNDYRFILSNGNTGDTIKLSANTSDKPSNGLFKLSSANTSINGFAIINWSALEDGIKLYEKDIQLSDRCFNLVFSPNISAYIKKDYKLYELPEAEYESLSSAVNAVEVLKRTIDNLTLRFYNTTSKEVEVWLYNYKGVNPEYAANFTNEANWIKLTNSKDVEKVSTEINNIKELISGKTYEPKVFTDNAIFNKVVSEFYLSKQHNYDKITIYNVENDYRFILSDSSSTGHTISYRSTEKPQNGIIHLKSANKEIELYAVISFDLLDDGAKFYLQDINLHDISFNVSFSPSVVAFLNRNDAFYKLANNSYDSLKSASLAVATTDRTINNLTLRFYNTTSKEIEIWLYNYKGENPEYASNFTNEGNWIKLAGNKDIKELKNKIDDVNSNINNNIGDIITQTAIHGDLDFSKITFEKNGLYYTDGSEFNSSVDLRSVDFIAIHPHSQMVTISVPDNEKISGIRVFFYDKDKAFTKQYGFVNKGNTEIVYSGKLEGIDSNPPYYIRLDIKLTDASFAEDVISKIGEYNLKVNIITSCERKEVQVSRKISYPNFVGIPIACGKGIHAEGTGVSTQSAKALVLAKELGYDWVEDDIQCTKDGHWVFLHDIPINLNGGLVVRKSDGVAVTKNDNIQVSKLTLEELKSTYRWADGCEIQTLKEGLNILTMLGMNILLEFKSQPKNQVSIDELVSCCKVFGIERIIYNATQTNYKAIFDMLVENEIYSSGACAITGGSISDVREVFEYARDLGHKTFVNVWSLGSYTNENGESITLNSSVEQIQKLIEEFGIAWNGRPAMKLNQHQVGLLTTNVYAPIKQYYPNEKTIDVSEISLQDEEYTNIGSFTIDKLSNVNILAITTDETEVYVSDFMNDVFVGFCSFARIMKAGTYNVYARKGKILSLKIRY